MDGNMQILKVLVLKEFMFKQVSPVFGPIDHIVWALEQKDLDSDASSISSISCVMLGKLLNLSELASVVASIQWDNKCAFPGGCL